MILHLPSQRLAPSVSALCLPPRDRKLAVLTTAPLETDPAWVEGFGVGLGGPGGLATSYFVQAYNEFFMGLERGVSGHRVQPSARCQGPSRGQGCKGGVLLMNLPCSAQH